VIEMYVNIDTDFFDKSRKVAEKEAIAELGEDDGKNHALWTDLVDNIEIDEISDANILVHIENKLGFFSFEIPLTTDNLIDILEIAVKKANKIKTLLEASKE
jgi:hypothetical protein